MLSYKLAIFLVLALNQMQANKKVEHNNTQKHEYHTQKSKKQISKAQARQLELLEKTQLPNIQKTCQKAAFGGYVQKTCENDCKNFIDQKKCITECRESFLVACVVKMKDDLKPSFIATCKHLCENTKESQKKYGKKTSSVCDSYCTSVFNKLESNTLKAEAKNKTNDHGLSAQITQFTNKVIALMKNQAKTIKEKIAP